MLLVALLGVLIGITYLAGLWNFNVLTHNNNQSTPNNNKLNLNNNDNKNTLSNSFISNDI